MAGIVVVGAGPGIGLSVARRFAREGLPVAVLARTGKTVQATAEALAPFEVKVVPLTTDSADDTSLREALDQAVAELGTPDVVVYNVAIMRADSPGELSMRAHQESWAANVVGALNTAAHIAPKMGQRGGGSVIITGGMPEPRPDYVSLSLGKAGVRTLVKLLDKEYGPTGVHVATVTVGGDVTPGTAYDPDDIAEQYWRLHTQPREEWEHEISFG